MSAPVFVGEREYFPGAGCIPFEGLASDNPLAFKVYDADKRVGGKSMREHLRFAVCYWHGFCGAGADPFGAPTRRHAWDQPATAMARAEARVDAVFEFCSKLGVPYYCFHDVDLAPEGGSILESERSLRHMVTMAAERQRATGVELLWGIANLCSHPRYANGAATNPDFDVVAHAAAQVRRALDATVELGGQNFVFWNGREGYASLLNTDMQRERAHLGRFLGLVRDYGRRIGFSGKFMIEPKPHEPMKHLYDFDAASVIGFLREHGLDNDFSLNIEANHAALAGHSFAHDLQVASDAGLLGSIDVNCGDANNRWDTVHFPNDIREAVDAMLVVLRQGGLAGGLNLDARLRRESTDPHDLLVAHIGGMDVFARALEMSHDLLEHGPLERWPQQRYVGFDDGTGRLFADGAAGLRDCSAQALHAEEPLPRSGRQEALENLVNTSMQRRASPEALMQPHSTQHITELLP